MSQGFKQYNKYGEPQQQTGRKTRTSHLLKARSDRDQKLSRTAIELFLQCPLCFYLTRVLDLKPPGMPSFSLNIAVDDLVKQSFETYRQKQEPHPLLIKNGLSNVVPFKHEMLPKWQDSLHGGLQLRHRDSHLILTGGVDDVWQDLTTNQLIVADAKATSRKSIIPSEYLKGCYQSYGRQMDIYCYILSGLGFDVGPLAYFLVFNGVKNRDFDNQLYFEDYLISYEWDASWVPAVVDEILDLLHSDTLPEPDPCCMNCAYAREFNIVQQTCG